MKCEKILISARIDGELKEYAKHNIENLSHFIEVAIKKHREENKNSPIDRIMHFFSRCPEHGVLAKPPKHTTDLKYCPVCGKPAERVICEEKPIIEIVKDGSRISD